jgi:glucokinase
VSKRFLGIEIGGAKLQFVIGDESAKVLERRRLAVASAQGAAGIRRQVEQTLPELLREHRLAAVGVGFGGPVDWRNGRIARSHQIEGWSEFDLAAWLQPLANAPVAVDNDANVAALGEARHGVGRGFNPVFYVTLGSGVGGGVVVDGNIYHGAPPGEAEVGHLRLDRQGTTLESRCSGWAVDARIRALKLKDPASALCRRLGQTAGGEAKHMAAALAQGDPAAERILRETAEDLAYGLSHVVHLYHPAIIILGGGLSGVGEPLRDAVQRALAPFLMEVFYPDLRVVLAALAEDAVPVGALELARASLGRADRLLSHAITSAPT